MLISPSTYQILKMLCMVFVVALSVLIFSRSYSLTQYFAIATVIGGLTIVTLADIYKSGPNGVDDEDSSKQTAMIILGVICMVFGQFFHALQMIVEEQIMQRTGAAG